MAALAAAGRNGLPVLHHADRLHSEPGQRLRFRRHDGRPGHFLRVDGQAPQGRRRHRACSDPNVRDGGAFVRRGQPGLHLRAHEAARPAARSRWTRSSRSMRPKLMAVPGILTFLQNPPPITISGQFTTSVYQMTLQSANLKEIYAWAPRVVDKMRTLPGFLDVNSRSADREPAGDGGYRPRPRRVARRHAASRSRTRCTPRTATGRSRPSITPANQYAVILGSGAAVSAQPGRAVEALRAVVAGHAGAARRGGGRVAHAWVR